MKSKLHEMEFKLKPYEWQLQAMREAEFARDYGLLAEMGTGKTGAMINILRLKYGQHGKLLRTLVLSPVVTLGNWKREFAIHSNLPDSMVTALDQATGLKKALKIQDKTIDGLGSLTKPHVFILNYEGLLNQAIFDRLLEWQPQVIVCDESHMCKNHKARRTKYVTKLADQAMHRFIMTGTPLLNNVDDIWSQFRILDRGELFGKSFALFKNKYMQDANETWKAKTNYFPKWIVRSNTMEELNQKIYSKAIRVTKDECLDLPPLIEQTISVPLSKAQEKAYKEMERDLIAWIEKEVDGQKGLTPVVANAAVAKAMKLQQIVTGFAVDDQGDVTEIDYENNPRIKICADLVQTIRGEGNKVILWCSFRNNYRQLERMCQALGESYVLLTGEQNAKQKDEAIQQFQNDTSIGVIIANRRAGGIGVNLTAASYGIVFSRDFSLANELQSEARNHRGGSEIHKKITKINLVAEGTMDEVALEALKNKQDISGRVIDLVRRRKNANGDG